MDLAWWIGVIGVPLVGAIFGVDLYIHKCAQTLIEELHDRIDAGSRELYEYKINSASFFATVTAVGEIKRELMGSLVRIEDQLQRLNERNDRRDRG